MTIIASSSEPGEGLKETSAPPILLDPQDRLPESSFFHRRVMMYLLIAQWIGLNAGVSFAIYKLGIKQPTDAIEAFTVQLKINSAVLSPIAVCFFIAPSAEQFARIIATLKAWKADILFRRSEPDPVSPGEPSEELVEAAPDGPAGPVQPMPEAAPAAPSDPLVKP
jgi:hypothetical protein